MPEKLADRLRVCCCSTNTIKQAVAAIGKPATFQKNQKIGNSHGVELG
jgi:hypothetical protein